MNRRVCRCGAIVEGKCQTCYRPPQHNKTTAQRGYGWDWQQLSLRKRAVDPLCENCLDSGLSVPATEVHHIKPIATHPELRLVWDNLMSVCNACHKEIEARTH